MSGVQIFRNVRIFDGVRLLPQRSVTVDRGLITGLGGKPTAAHLRIVDG